MSKIARVITHAPAMLEPVPYAAEAPSAAARQVVPAGVGDLIEAAVGGAPWNLAGLPGPALWEALHRRALWLQPGAEDREWLRAFRRVLPCGDCRRHWDGMLATTPPPAAPDLFAWGVQRHNEVNRRLGKPEMTLQAALQRWSGSLAGRAQRPV